MGEIRNHAKGGLYMKFDNNYAISIQFKPCNYCDNYDMGSDDAKFPISSSNVEIAIFDPDGAWYDFEEHKCFLTQEFIDKQSELLGDDCYINTTDVKGYVPVDELVDWINFTKEQ